MKTNFRIPLLVLLLAGTVAAGIYKWIDDEGRVHFGANPPQEYESREITPPQAPTEEDVRQSQERLNRLMEYLYQSEGIRKEQQSKKQFEQLARQQKAVENKRLCIRARQNLYTLMQDRPAFWINEKGEREFLDDSDRAAIRELLEKEIEAYCE